MNISERRRPVRSDARLGCRAFLQTASCELVGAERYVLLALVFLLYFPVETLIARLNEIFDMRVFDSIQ